jgi:hypothetical protein
MRPAQGERAEAAPIAITDGKKWLRNWTTIPARADERLKRTQPIKADGNGASDFIKEEAYGPSEEPPKS